MRATAVMLVALALGACGGTGRLKPDTPPGVNLAGTWHLNRQASQDPQPLIERMRQDELKRMRRYMREVGEDDPDLDVGGGAGQRRGPHSGAEQGTSERDRGDQEHAGMRHGRFSRVPYEEALGPALTSDSLQIEQSPTRFVIIRGDSKRSFTPGGDSVVSVAQGVADQHSGWSGREYVIEVRPQVGPRVIERYGLSADGRRLVEKFTLTEEGWPKLEFTRVYDPGAAAPRSLPSN
ncbi:MAG TPA: hypothetical protein VG994_00620 [Steroidobacteraceae bacterium]|nr:hypothetical protein [Steroidobacteraceae bacterium]